MSTNFSKNQWAIDFLKSLGNTSPIPECVNFVHAWEEMESGASDTSPADFNPLNTTQRMSGSTSFNSAGVQNFTSYSQGVDANKIVLQNGLYPTLLKVLTENINPLDSAYLAAVSGDLTVWVSGNRSPLDSPYINAIIQISETLGGNSMTWYDRPICISFGTADAGYNGAHDMDVQTLPNTQVTSIVSGIITDLSAPSWGKMVCLKLDDVWLALSDGVQWFAYLHLAAINPALKVGGRLEHGEVVGWSGGCTSANQYNGTSNPTGSNFLNATSQSSQPQTGIALMHGPVYGSGNGWSTYPLTECNPIKILNAARAGTPPVSNKPNTKAQSLTDMWNVFRNTNENTGIGKSWLEEVNKGNLYGPALTDEVDSVTWQGGKIKLKIFAGGWCEWHLDTNDGPAGAHWFKWPN